MRTVLSTKSKAKSLCNTVISLEGPLGVTYNVVALLSVVFRAYTMPAEMERL